MRGATGFEVTFDFDDRAFQELQSPEQKLSYLLNSLGNLVSVEKGLVGQATANTVASVGRLFGCVSGYVDQLSNENIELLSNGILICQQFLRLVPHSECYVKFSEELIEHMKETAQPYESAFKALAKNREFCATFLASGKLQDHFRERIDNPNTKMLDAFMNEVMFSEIMKNDGVQMIRDLLLCITSAGSKNKVVSSHAVSFVFRLIKYGCQTNSRLFDLLGIVDILSEITKLLLSQADQSRLWNLYHILLSCGQCEDLPINPTVMQQLFLAMKSEEILVDNELVILRNIRMLNIYQSPFCINPVFFPLATLVTEKLVKSEDCFEVYLQIVEVCSDYSSEVLVSPVRTLIEFLKPPIKRDYQLNIFFKWLLRMIRHKNVSIDILNDELFLTRFFTANDNVPELFLFGYFEPLFETLINEARNPDLPDEIYTKLFELDLDRFLENDFAFGLVRFLVRNAETEKMRNYLLAHMDAKVPQWFKLGSVFRILNMTSESYMKAFLCVVREAVRISNDHLFDDFVLDLPANSPIFSLPSSLVREYVFDNDHVDGRLFIPSLLPLIDFEYNTESCYNLYLMGRYSVPVYRKLNKKIPWINKVLNYFVRYEDYSYFLSQELIDFSKMERQPVGCYEFLPGSAPAWIEIPPKSDSVFVAFWARLEGVCDKPTEFLHFNDVTLYFQDDCLVLPNGKRRRLECMKWYLFILRKGDYLNRTNLYIDNDRIYAHRKLLDFGYIGSKTDSISVRFSIARNMVYLQTPAEDKFKLIFKPSVQKEMTVIVSPTVGSAPLYSLSMILSDEIWLFHNIDRLDSIKSQYMFCAVIEAISVILPKNIEHYFKRLQGSLIQFGNIDWLDTYIDKIFEQPDLHIRTRLFTNFFYDVGLWDSLPQSSIQRICQKCASKLQNVNMDYNLILNKDRFRFLLALLHFVKEKHYIFPVIKTMGEKCETVESIVPIVLVANLWRPNLSAYAAEFDTRMLFEVAKSSEIQDILMQFLLYFEKLHKRSSFTYDQLIGLSLCLSPEIGLSLFAAVLAKTKVAESQTHLPILCMVAMRYATKAEIWSRVIRKAVGIDDFSIDIADDLSRLKAKVVFSSMICLLFAMLMSMSGASSQFLAKCHSAVIVIISNNPTLIFEDPVFDYFLMFIRGKIEPPDQLPYTIDTAKLAPIQAYEAATLQTKFQEQIPQFVSFVNTMQLEHTSQPEHYVKFASRLMDLLFVKVQGERRLVKKLISAVPSCASDEIAATCLESFYKHALTSKLKEDVVDVLVKSSFYCANARPGVLKEGLLTVICQFAENTQCPSVFIRFMLYILEIMSTTIIDRFLRALSQHFTVKDSLNLLQRMSALKVTETPVIEAWFQDVKSVAKQESCGVSDLVQTANTYSEFVELSNELADIPKSDMPLNVNVDLIKEKINISENMFMHLFYIAVSNCVICFYENQQFYFSLNKQLREKEKLFAMQFKKTTMFKSQTLTPDQLKEETKSYHISPFGIPASPRTMMLPSYFTMVTPNSEKQEPVELRTSFFNMTPTLSVNAEVTKEYPLDLYRYSSLFQCTPTALLNHFVEMFGDYEKIGDCELVRLEMRIPCIYFIHEKDIYLLTDASLKNEMISFRKITPHLAESVLLNEFGSYSLFCGHFVIIVRYKDIMLAHKYVSCTVMRSKMIYTVSGGAFVLENVLYDTMAAHECFAHNVTEVMDKYHASQISTFDFLTIINLIGYRSFSDLSAYPIFPRLIADFYGDNPFATPKLRDLSVPVPVFADPDQDHAILTSRMNMQGYHHAENVSNPVVVSSFNIRLFPFATYMWDVNNGWDHADRNFLSIPFHLTISKRTAYELIPELFCFPEVLLNINHFTPPDGSSFDVALPNGVSSVYKFIELHRHVLESKEVNAHLHSWIDLIFGCKQASVADLNCYSPMSYQSRDVMKGQKTWMMTCGQVPKQIFAEPCSPRTETHTARFNTNLVVLKVMEEKYDHMKLGGEFQVGIGQLLCLKKSGTVIFSNDLSIPLSTEIHTSVSKDSQYIAITFSVSVVMVVRVLFEKLTIPSEFRFQNRLICESPKFSVINSKQLICATVCERNVVIWSISTGLVINFVNLENVSSLLFDDPMSTMYIAQKNVLYQFTLNGNLVRQIALDSDITCLAVCGRGFSFVDRIIISGHVDGTVQLSCVHLADQEFSSIFKRKASHAPIEHIVANQNSYEIEIYPMRLQE